MKQAPLHDLRQSGQRCATTVRASLAVLAHEWYCQRVDGGARVSGEGGLTYVPSRLRVVASDVYEIVPPTHILATTVVRARWSAAQEPLS
jgi:hypothetical protein